MILAFGSMDALERRSAAAADMSVDVPSNDFRHSRCVRAQWGLKASAGGLRSAVPGVRRSGVAQVLGRNEPCRGLQKTCHDMSLRLYLIGE